MWSCLASFLLRKSKASMDHHVWLQKIKQKCLVLAGQVVACFTLFHAEFTYFETVDNKISMEFIWPTQCLFFSYMNLLFYYFVFCYGAGHATEFPFIFLKNMGWCSWRSPSIHRGSVNALPVAPVCDLWMHWFPLKSGGVGQSFVRGTCWWLSWTPHAKIIDSLSLTKMSRHSMGKA